MLRRLGRPELEQEVEAWVARAERWAAVCRSLPNTSERQSIDASLRKRLVFLRPADWQDHLSTAIRFYAESAARVAEDLAVDDRDLYGFRNALQLASFVAEVPDPLDRLITPDWVDCWAEDLGTASRSGDFWRQVGRADSMLTATMVPSSSTLADRLRSVGEDLAPLRVEGLHRFLQASVEESSEEISAAYLAVRHLARIREWSSVLEHLELMSDIAHARSHQDARAIAEIHDRVAGS